MNYSEYIIRYNEHGMKCLPTKPDKTPASSQSWLKGFPPEEFIDCFAFGIICGKESGGIECLDFDNHQGDATRNLKTFLDVPEIKTIYDQYKLPIESTVGGGYHLIYRCDTKDGNRKLASRLFNGKPDAFIETRGEGGYFCAYPSPGYQVVRNDLLNIQHITTTERATLIDVAMAMNEYFPPLKTDFEGGDKPGDIYNESPSAGPEMKSLLEKAGWKQVSDYKWRRPDKDNGYSATLGKVAPNVLYVFSSGAYPFEPLRSYTPFQVLGLLKFNGDWKAAAKSLAPPREQTQPKVKIELTEIEKILNNARIDTTKVIEKPPTILAIKEVGFSTVIYKRLFTLGNFSCIIGKAKTRKTFLLSLLSASLLNPLSNNKFQGEMPSHKNKIIYFDTEQSEYDCFNTIRRIEYMAGTSVNLRGYSLRQYSPIERCQIIEHAFKLWGDEIGFCAIDGIADLANAINDEDEATRVTTMLLRLTKIHNCHITTVIHQNKNDNFATGHLGSSIMKKAEILIAVTKGKENKEITQVDCDLSRGVDFESFEMIINQEGIPEVRGLTKGKQYKPLYETDDQDSDITPTETIPF